MAQRVEIRLTGSGEQGVILAGVILAEAAALYDDRNAVQSQSYGPEARGGASRSEVIVSDDEIDDPKTSELDVLVTLTQEACDKYVGDLRSGGLLLVDMDQDGLGDKCETDPRLMDTDKGGESDGSEVLKTGHNPLDPKDDFVDTDGDGIVDKLEDKNGNGKVDPGETDPKKKETDGDGIDDGKEERKKKGR